MVVRLLPAVQLTLRVRGMAYHGTTFFMPTVVPLLAICVLWDQLLNPDHGLVNEALRAGRVAAGVAD